MKKNNWALKGAYEIVHGKEPENLEDWEIARRIVEVLDNPKWVPPDLAKECAYAIVCGIAYPNRETMIAVVYDAEEMARKIFPELKNIGEIHMDQIEWAYNNWKTWQIRQLAKETENKE